MKNKNKVIILASIIVGVLVVTLGLTYAVLSFNETKGNSQLVLGDIWMHYGETNQLVLSDAMPMDIKDYITYKVNPVMESQEVVDNELSRCVDYFKNVQVWDLDVGETFESYCKGTGTEFGRTFQEDLDGWMLNETDYFDYLSTNNIIIDENETYVVNPIITNQEMNELSRCVWIFRKYEDEIDTGSSLESFCKGNGTAWGGVTLSNEVEETQKFAKSEGYDFLEILIEGQKLLDSNIIIPQIENLPYFEFTIDGKNTYAKKDIWYEIVLNHGDNHDIRTTRIKDDLLRFSLVEVKDGNEFSLINGRKYSNLTNKRIYVDTIPANTNKEINKTYRLYMWISEDTVIGNMDEDYTLEEWNDVFASIKVSVTGDFQEKELAYEDKYNVTDASCFTTREVTVYEHNSNIIDEEIALCVTIFRDEWQWELRDGEDWESFCKGTGTALGATFQETINDCSYGNDQLIYLEENNIVTSETGIQIEDYDTTCGTDVVIPKTINGYNVISIGHIAFVGNQLISVVIPEGVMAIHNNAFCNNNLSSVEIPDSVTYLSCYAFDNTVTINKSSDLTCFDDIID